MPLWLLWKLEQTEICKSHHPKCPSIISYSMNELHTTILYKLSIILSRDGIFYFGDFSLLFICKRAKPVVVPTKYVKVNIWLYSFQCFDNHLARIWWFRFDVQCVVYRIILFLTLKTFMKLNFQCKNYHVSDSKYQTLVFRFLFSALPWQKKTKFWYKTKYFLHMILRIYQNAK